ncbi:MAG: response regulator [Rhizonema sp. PD37]|nr:response regulator [Rhizonema sp. PD37]
MESQKQIPAIALTACVSEFEQQQVNLAGFQKLLAKPVEQAELITVISSLTGRNI